MSALEMSVENSTNSSLIFASSAMNLSDGVHFDYCGEDLKSFRVKLSSIYGVLSVTTCTFGLLTNSINIVVLTRKSMWRSATNAILSAISAADFLFLVSILLYNIFNYDIVSTDACFVRSYGVKWLSLIVIRSALTLHSISVVLTIMLAIWRYIAVTHPLKIREWCSLYRTYVGILVCYLFVPVGNIILYMSRTIAPVIDSKEQGNTALNIALNPSQNTSDCTVYEIVHTAIADLGNSMFYNVAFWIYGVVFKIIPSFALLVFSIILVRTLYFTSKERSKLTQNSNTRMDRSCERTTKMLLAILILFLITELPQGVLLSLVALLGTGFYDTCYSDLVEVNDYLEIINSSLNFIFYYAMSKQFRRTFLGLFSEKSLGQEKNSTKSQESTVTHVETNC